MSLFASTYCYTIRKQLGPTGWDRWIKHQLPLLDEANVPGLRALFEVGTLETTHVSVNATGSIAMARSQMAGLFLASDADVWVSVDDDNYTDRSVFEQLVRTARATRGMVAAPYWLRQEKPRVSFAYDGPPNTFRCDGVELATGAALRTGFGVVAVHRQAVEKVAELVPTFRTEYGGPWPACFLELVADEHWIGEDFSFCYRCHRQDVSIALLCNAFVEHDGVGCMLAMVEGELRANRVERPSEGKG